MVHCEKCGFPINAAGCMCGKVVPKRPQPNVTRAQKDAAEQSVQRIGLWARIKKWLGAIQSAAQQSVQVDGGGRLLSSDRAVDGIRPRYKVDYGRWAALAQENKMTYEDFYKISTIANGTLVAEEFVMRVYSALEKFRLDIQTAQHQMHLTDGGLPASDSESPPRR